MNDIHQQQLKQVRESVYEENLRLRAELAAANEFKKHYTDLISVNAELMGAPNDGSITDSVVQIEKLVKKLRADLDAANEEVEKLRERLGPHGLVVVDIDKTGHYVSEKVADEITRLRTDLAVANERCEMLTKEVVEWRSRPDALPFQSVMAITLH
jgi:phosphoribosyl-dephospho-CoA transferase